MSIFVLEWIKQKCCKNGKMLSHSVFKSLLYHGRLKSGLFVKFVELHLTLERYHLTHYQTTNFRLVQIETVCRQKF